MLKTLFMFLDEYFQEGEAREGLLHGIVSILKNGKAEDQAMRKQVKTTTAIIVHGRQACITDDQFHIKEGGVLMVLELARALYYETDNAQEIVEHLLTLFRTHPEDFDTVFALIGEKIDKTECPVVEDVLVNTFRQLAAFDRQECKNWLLRKLQERPSLTHALCFAQPVV